MADAKRCDRCGKYYSKNDNGRCNLSYHDLPYYEKYDVDEEYIIPTAVSFSENCSNYYKFELCPDCMRKLIHFIAKEETNGNSSKDN